MFLVVLFSNDCFSVLGRLGAAKTNIIKQYKTALYILTNFELRNKYNNLIYSNDNIIETNNNIIEANNDNDVSLDSLFNNILDNNDNTINIPNSKSKSLEQMNNYMSNRIFDTINKKPNNIIINNLIPIQTREDRKLVN